MSLGLFESLSSFSCIASLGLADGNQDAALILGMWLGKMNNLQELVVKDVEVNVSNVALVLSNMTKLHSLTISNTTMKERLPKHWLGTSPPWISPTIWFKAPCLQFFGELQHLEFWDLSNYNITGHLPRSLGRLKSLQKLAIARNAMWGPIPNTFVNLSKLTYLDLCNNRISGSIPDALASSSALRYLDLRNNDLKGILPFNTSFVSKFNTFKVSGNPGLCYDKTITSGKVVPGLPHCGEYGNPVVKPLLCPPELVPFRGFWQPDVGSELLLLKF